MPVRIITGDCRTVLATMPDQSVHCCVTSPPYFGLRDYGTASWRGGDPECDHRSPTMRDGRNEDRAKLAGSAATNSAQLLLAHRTGCGKCGAVKMDSQIGLEATPDAYVAEMVAVFRDVRRVLRDDGTLWLNLGDSYNGYMANQRGTGLETGRQQSRKYIEPGAGLRFAGLKQKDLIGIPWRVAFALQADGWYLRQDIIWSKPNPMPESVTDRCTKAHEYLFLLSKSAKYYYDADAIKESSITNDPRRPYTSDGAWAMDGRPTEQRHGGKPRTADNKSHKYTEAYEASTTEEHRTKAGLLAIADAPWEQRNRRSVWTIATAPYAEAHFATFPPDLIEPCIKAGCPESGTVLDPFGGAGTTGLVADRLKRNAILIELNPEYAEMAERRLNNDGGMFASVEVSRVGNSEKLEAAE